MTNATESQRRATLSLLERIAQAKVQHGAKNATAYVTEATKAQAEFERKGSN
jgi:hypothetical protein